MNIHDFVQRYVTYSIPRVFPQQSVSQFVFYKQAALHLDIIARQEPGRLYFTFADKLVGKLIGMRPDTVSSRAAKICKNKQIVNKLLAARHFPVPDGRAFHATSYSNAKHYFKHLPGSKVIKPVDGRAGAGVSVGILEVGAFATAFNKARAASSSEFVLIEKEVSGIDVRTIVVNGKAICSSVRVPAFVIGDGVSSINTLISIKNTFRASHPYHGKHLISHDAVTEQTLREQALCLDSTPTEGHIVFLSKLGNVHRGAEAVDVTHLIPNKAKTIVEDASTAIEGLGSSGIDYKISDFSEDADICLIEINTSPNFGMHVMPMHGTSYNPARAVLLHMMRRSFC
jgi:cyanophycin synthetase